MMDVVAILAVLPDYRESFLTCLRERFASTPHSLTLVAGDIHTDPTVKSGRHDDVVFVKNSHLFGRRLLWQQGALRYARHADVIVTDLNPRSLSAWVLLFWSRLTRRRLLMWGHISPRAGAESRTAPLRRWMRRRADGVISYTWSDADRVRFEDKTDAVWVASNGLYERSKLIPDMRRERFRLTYVGRLEPAKKPRLLIEGFALALSRLGSDALLTVVGTGSEEVELHRLARELRIQDRVEFLGRVTDVEILREIYSESVASASPGYVGLSLTQSLGFGVPMIVADREPHAPEVELLNMRTGVYFEADNPESLSDKIVDMFMSTEKWDREEISASVSTTYSAESMADGFFDAVVGGMSATSEGNTTDE